MKYTITIEDTYDILRGQVPDVLTHWANERLRREGYSLPQ